MLYCSGYCRNDPLLVHDPDTQPDVISLSAAEYEQRAWGSSDGTSMTQVLIQILCRSLLFRCSSWRLCSQLSIAKEPHPSLHTLLTRLRYLSIFLVYVAAVTDEISLFSHGLHDFYTTLHEKARAYREKTQLLNEEGKTEQKRQGGNFVELNNFHNPQVGN